jgi:hypothetical protein
MRGMTIGGESSSVRLSSGIEKKPFQISKLKTTERISPFYASREHLWKKSFRGLQADFQIRPQCTLLAKLM